MTLFQCDGIPILYGMDILLKDVCGLLIVTTTWLSYDRGASVRDKNSAISSAGASITPLPI